MYSNIGLAFYLFPNLSCSNGDGVLCKYEVLARYYVTSHWQWWIGHRQTYENNRDGPSLLGQSLTGEGTVTGPQWLGHAQIAATLPRIGEPISNWINNWVSSPFALAFRVWHSDRYNIKARENDHSLSWLNKKRKNNNNKSKET